MSFIILPVCRLFLDWIVLVYIDVISKLVILQIYIFGFTTKSPEFIYGMKIVPWIGINFFKHFR